MVVHPGTCDGNHTSRATIPHAARPGGSRIKSALTKRKRRKNKAEHTKPKGRGKMIKSHEWGGQKQAIQVKRSARRKDATAGARNQNEKK